jgi:hypothetical protein
VTEVQSILGLINFYRRFIQGCATICACLTVLLQKGVEFIWSDSCDAAFNTLKRALTEAPILAYPDLRKPFRLYTDASGLGIGSVLQQIQPDKTERVIAYVSRNLKKYEANYGVTELELLAIVWSLGYFRPYLLGSSTTIITDHQAGCSRRSVPSASYLGA